MNMIKKAVFSALAIAIISIAALTSSVSGASAGGWKKHYGYGKHYSNYNYGHYNYKSKYKSNYNYTNNYGHRYGYKKFKKFGYKGSRRNNFHKGR